MKRIGYLLTEETVTLDLCKKAILQASKNKRKRESVKKVLGDFEAKSEELRRLILDETYQPSPYKCCNIVDHPSGKARVLHKPKFYPDQCVHHIIILLLGDELLKRLDPYCIASIPKRGIHYGHRAIRRWLQRSRTDTRYCLKCDIKKCYDNIRPPVVVAAVARFVKDKKFLRLIAKVAYSHPSLPLGNYTSGWLQNLVMAPLDRLIRQQKDAKHYLRYVDDFIILGLNKRKLRNMLDSIRATLATLGLQLKENWQIFPVDERGIDMLGYRFYRHHTTMRKRNVLALMRTIRAYQHRPTPARARSLLSRIGGCKWFSSYNFWQKHCQLLDFKQIKRRAYA